MIGNGTNECHAYMSQMDNEHRRLNHQLDELRELFQHAETDRSVDDQLKLYLQQLNEELSKHFTEEEQGGCIEEAACRCPSLAHDVSIIERQHRELKAQLAALISAVEQSHSQASDAFEKFTQALEEHETLETQILQRGFNTANEV